MLQLLPRKLAVLSLTNNRLQTFHPGRKLPDLVELSLHGNRLTGVAEQLGVLLPRLESLYLGDNRHLGRLPASLGQLSRLQTLDASGCGLEALPVGLFKRLRRLESLWVSDNRLTELPLDCTGLGALRELYLQNNRLQDLPGSLPHTQLAAFNAHNNLFFKTDTDLQRAGGRHLPWRVGVLTLKEICSRVLFPLDADELDTLPQTLRSHMDTASTPCAGCAQHVFEHYYCVWRFRVVCVYYRLPLRFVACCPEHLPPPGQQ